MYNYYFISKSYLCILVCSFFHFYTTAQNDPFNCDYNAYLFQYNDVYAINLASGSDILVAEDVTPGSINAAAYNSKDGYIWGSLSTPEKTIVRIGADFSTTTYTFDALPTNNRYVGDVDLQGIYYLKPGGTTVYRINLDPASPNYLEALANVTLSANINIHDWAFNALDNQLYTVEKGSNILYRIDAPTGAVTSLGVVPILDGFNYTYGAVYFDASGNFYVSSNQTGTIYIINNVNNLNPGSAIASNLFAYGPSSNSNDGARCPTAPVPQEDCTNGIDDDGDGLVDCDDPSCSGVASCPVLDPASSANDGGLESNDRLADKIHKRNYLRTKANYSFNTALADRLDKNVNYGVRSNALSLNNFIPIDVIEETETVVSTPTDLPDITNATAVLSVDYVKNNETVAALLALETTNGVYEHTKYICDRFLGAALLSLSTIWIGDEQFICSQIKNADGTKEFVVSLSGYLNNNDDFIVESHWNLDRYASNTNFYNFQIWANTIDDLLLLVEEVLTLMDAQRTIVAYNNSLPPKVYVKKGAYINGEIVLDLVNTNTTHEILIEGGIKNSETDEISTYSEALNLNENYTETVYLSTGNLFDFGFRINGNPNDTPDDIFLSDAPWGYDDSDTGTTINAYTIDEQVTPTYNDGFALERGLHLEATINNYVAAYRAFHPRFYATDISDYNTVSFKGYGTGALEITLVKESIDTWENQPRTSVLLNENEQEFVLLLNDFTANGAEVSFNDVKTIVFTMRSLDQTVQTKEMHLKDVVFTYQNGDVLSILEHDNMVVHPNPITNNSTVSFFTLNPETISLNLVNMLGQKVHSKTVEATSGINTITIGIKELPSGYYILNLRSNNLALSKKIIVN